MFAIILNSSVMLGSYLQQTTSADDIFRCIFIWPFKGYICHFLGTQYLVNLWLDLGFCDLEFNHHQGHFGTICMCLFLVCLTSTSP